MGRIRSFVEDDIPQVADLHERVFGRRTRSSPQKLHAYFAEIFFHNPWYDEDLPSLVYEADRGRIAGFLGVLPRPMSMNGCPVQMAISTQFMVEPGSRSSLAAVQLLRTFFSGPQDLSMTDGANTFSRKIWEGCGGATAYLYSIHWLYPLRPTRYMVSLLKRRKLLAPFAYALSPFCRAADALAAGMPRSPFRQMAPRVPGEDLEEKTFLACLPGFARGRSFRPDYDDCSLRWLLGMAAQKKGPGTLRKVVVRGTGQETLGWYLYYVNPGNVGEVLQIAARDSSVNEVLDHLFYEARLHGMIALSGRLEPRFMEELAEKHCLFHRGGPWTLVHSHNPELLQAIHMGDAFLTRLEGEWWMRFHEDG